MAKSALILVLALFATTTFAYNAACYGYNDSLGAVFEIDSLSKNTSDYLANVTGGVLRYNFCDQVSVPANTNSSAVLQTDSNTTVKLTIGTIPKFLARDPSNPLGGIYLAYPPGDRVPGATGNVTYNYTVALSCVEGGAYAVSNVSTSGSNSQIFLVSASAKQGCPVFAFYQLTNFVTKYKFAFIIAGIVIGVFIGFFGLKLFKPTLFLTAFVVVFLLMAFIFFTFILGISPSAGAQWGCLAGALALGVLAGVLMVKLEKVGVFFLGAWLGTSGSFLLYNLILSHFNAGRVTLIIFTVAAAIICGIFALLVFEHAIIIATSLGGAYLAIRGVSLFAPAKYAFPNEIETAREIQYNGFASIPPIFYLYFSLILILAVGGGFVQYKHKKSRDEENSQQDVGYQGLAYNYHQHP